MTFPSFHTSLLVAIFGGLGALTRYLLTIGISFVAGKWFFLGTLCANFIGCFFAGGLWGLVQKHMAQSIWQIPLSIGFLGGFTTFSTFSLETLKLFQSPLHVFTPWLYLFGSALGGLAFAWLGYRSFIFFN